MCPNQSNTLRQSTIGETQRQLQCTSAQYMPCYTEGRGRFLVRAQRYACADLQADYPTGTQLVATASYFLNDCLSKPAEKSDMQSLLLAKSFAGMAEDCLGATVAEGGWLETGERSTGPRETLFTVKASILSELEQLAK